MKVVPIVKIVRMVKIVPMARDMPTVKIVSPVKTVHLEQTVQIAASEKIMPTGRNDRTEADAGAIPSVQTALNVPGKADACPVKNAETGRNV